jgi:GH25 family lysozyme M1 (1,4-beta-N-acetylmuramidase)
MANHEIVEWIQTAPGVSMNPDGHYGLQCVDLVDQYAQDIFGVPWNVCVGGVTGARELLDVVPDAYWIRIDNDPNDPNLIPQQGDVIVFGGSVQNKWGHTLVCDTADHNGFWGVQQDGFAPPVIFVDGNYYSNKPAHRVWLPYYGPGTGVVTGWLRPREEKIIGYVPPVVVKPPDTTPPLPYQRDTGAARVGYRKSPAPDGELIEWLEADHRYDFRGYVHKTPVNGEDRWLVGKYSGGFAWIGGFVDQDTHDLPDITAELFPAPPPVAPPDVIDFPYLLGFDVSVHQDKASLNLLPGDFVGIKATEGGADWTDKALESNVAEARLGGKRVLFYHYARPLVTEQNTAIEEARSFLKAITPHVQPGDLVALDWEAENQSRTDWALEWLRIVQNVTGATPFVYLNTPAINGGDWSAVEAEFPLWFAYYGANTPATGYTVKPLPVPLDWTFGPKMWQYTSTGHLPGYEGPLDLNIFFGTKEDLDKLAVKTKVPTVPTEPDKPGTYTEDIKTLREFAAWIDGFVERLGE